MYKEIQINFVLVVAWRLKVLPHFCFLKLSSIGTICISLSKLNLFSIRDGMLSFTNTSSPPLLIADSKRRREEALGSRLFLARGFIMP